MRARPLASVLVALVAVGCTAASPRYRDTKSLKSVVMGEPKDTLLAIFGPRDQDERHKAVAVERIKIRARERSPGGETLEIAEVPLADPASGEVMYYWFLFKDERLAVWGRAGDWTRISGQYPIKFEPHPTPAPSR